MSAPPPPPPPPPAPKADAPAPAAGGGMAAVFKEINASGGTGISSGLKHVEDKDKAKNRADRSGLVSADALPAKEPAKAAPGKGVKKMGEPKFVLNDKRWEVEWQHGKRSEKKELSIDITAVEQAVSLYECEDVFLTINGKLNSITMVNCKRTQVLFESCVAVLEITACERVESQCQGKLPTAMIEKSSEVNLYLSRDCAYNENADDNTKIMSATSSAMNVTIPGKTDDDDAVEMALPEQFVTSIVPGTKPKINTVPADHSD